MNKELTIKQYINSQNVQDRIREVLHGKSSQFIISLLSTVNSDNKLAGCEPQSVLNAAMTAASLDLPINQNLGFAYIIAYKDQAQFQMGYKGFVQLAVRSGQFKTINVTDVREGEMQGIDRLSGEITFGWVSDEAERGKLPVIGYIAYMKLKTGFEKSFYMTTKELTAHGVRFSQTMKKGYGLWKDDFDAMAKKTVIKLLLSKYAPLTTDMQTAQLADQAIIDENGYKYIDNKKLTPDEVAQEKEMNRIKAHIANATTLEELELCQAAIDDYGESELQEAYKARKAELEAKE